MDDVANLTSAPATAQAPPKDAPSGILALSLGSVGVVYGDIGTSPLYAFREAVAAAGPVTRDTVLGVLSLILWALIIVVTIKYVIVLLRADNNGEGGWHLRRVDHQTIRRGEQSAPAPNFCL